MFKTVVIERIGTNFFGTPFKEKNKISISIDQVPVYLSRKEKFFPADTYNIERTSHSFKAYSKAGDYCITYKVER